MLSLFCTGEYLKLALKLTLNINWKTEVRMLQKESIGKTAVVWESWRFHFGTRLCLWQGALLCLTTKS